MIDGVNGVIVIDAVCYFNQVQSTRVQAFSVFVAGEVMKFYGSPAAG